VDATNAVAIKKTRLDFYRKNVAVTPPQSEAGLQKWGACD
jgi:hypothetical protein